MSNYSSGVLNRRKRALQRLKEQLKLNTKPLFVESKQTTDMVPLSDTDIKRIEKEIKVLESKI